MDKIELSFSSRGGYYGNSSLRVTIRINGGRGHGFPNGNRSEIMFELLNKTNTGMRMLSTSVIEFDVPKESIDLFEYLSKASGSCILQGDKLHAIHAMTGEEIIKYMSPLIIAKAIKGNLEE